MALRLFSCRNSLQIARFGIRAMSGEYGSGAGKGGGSGGSVREAGGSFGKMEAAHEEQYFRKMQTEQLKSLKKEHITEIQSHQELIKHHEEAIARHKEKLGKLKSLEKKGSDTD
ncbi:unnamed protein product [Owenia fusiformis]|uniref:ATP synthase F1 subunit epsilon n=1 Tax=Owenia fusiformis TaxID=6347 RepID=A0A8J1U8H2_OWEFU|nr:unnamed protein product [Owenia fusiformis]